MKLKLFKVTEGGKYTAGNPLEVDFTKSKKVGLAGDSGEGKTTGLTCFKMILGAVAGEQLVEDLLNADSGKLDIEQTFRGNDGEDYVLKMTKSQFYLRREGEKKDIPAPKEKIIDLIGRVACNPMELKNATVDGIVKWLAAYSKRGEEGFTKDMAAIKDGLKKAKSSRAESNKAVKARREMLSEAGYADSQGQIIEQSWVAAEQKYAKKQDIKALSARLDEAGKKSDRLLQAETKLKQLKTREEQLLAELATVQADIKKGEAYVEANKAAKADYDTVRKEYDNAAQFAAEYEAWQSILRMKAEMDEYESIAQRADAKEKDLLEQKKQLEWEVIPDCRGIEIVLEDEYEDNTLVRKAGFYADGFNSRQMSATDFLTSILKPLRKLGVKILILDDTSTYGSPLMAEFEKMAREGWYILYAEQRRGQELTIEY